MKLFSRKTWFLLGVTFFSGLYLMSLRPQLKEFLVWAIIIFAMIFAVNLFFPRLKK